MLAAKAMIERLKTTERVEIIGEMEALCDAYIHLANWPVDKYKKETSKLGSLMVLDLIRAFG